MSGIDDLLYQWMMLCGWLTVSGLGEGLRRRLLRVRDAKMTVCNDPWVVLKIIGPRTRSLPMCVWVMLLWLRLFMWFCTIRLLIVLMGPVGCALETCGRSVWLCLLARCRVRLRRVCDCCGRECFGDVVVHL